MSNQRQPETDPLAFPSLGYTSRSAIACHPDNSRGRLIDEPASPTRTDYQRDRDRIIHSTAFRRLKYKTQVFVYHEGDHYRTRLTHTLEVAQIARSIARAFRLDEDLSETIALAHDLGHTPFGHVGEDTLDACIKDHGGYDHNAQSLRIVTKLERRYPAFEGLNLTWEALEGIVKHNGPLTGPLAQGEPLPHALKAYEGTRDLLLHQWPSLEAQIAALADDIAYTAHDIDDGLRAGFFTLTDLHQVPLVARLLDTIAKQWPGLDVHTTTCELTRRLITVMVEDAMSETKARLDASGVASVNDVRQHGKAIAQFSQAMMSDVTQLKTYLFSRMYRHAHVMEERAIAEETIRGLYAHYCANPAAMPIVSDDAENESDAALARRAADYIAGMTDRYALQAFEEIKAKM